MREPKAFLMDEPLSNLDAKLRAQMRVELAELHKRLGTTMIYVTHDQTEAMTLGTKIVVMKDGYIQQADTPKAIYENPANLFVAGFIGSPSMNFFEGKIRRTDKGADFELGSGAVLEIPEDKAFALANEYRNKSVILGVRPEHFFHRGNCEGSEGGLHEAYAERKDYDQRNARCRVHVLSGREVRRRICRKASCGDKRTDR